FLGERKATVAVVVYRNLLCAAGPFSYLFCQRKFPGINNSILPFHLFHKVCSGVPALRQRLLKPIDNRFAGVVIYGKSTVVGPVSLRCQTEPCTNRRPAASLLLLKLKTAVKFLIVCVNILIHT